MTDGTLLAALRHNCWANLQLLGFCAKLTDEQRAWTIPGTYGSIHQTLQHTIGAEHGYLFALTGGELPPGGPLTPDRLAPIDELNTRARSNAERIERALDGLDPDRVITRRDRGTATARVIASQFIHHGSDHRAHVGSILGAHGVEPPDIDVWAYGRAIGEVTPPPG
jgi:uncharacterized damage-inducible protein DinB